MTYLEALDSLARAKHLQAGRFRELCAENNLKIEQRDAYRQLVIDLATGEQRPKPTSEPYPSLARMAGNAMKAAGQFVASGFAVASEDEQARRLAICQEPCEHYDVGAERCRKCGCKTKFKARIANSHCPISKWGSHH